MPFTWLTPTSGESLTEPTVVAHSEKEDITNEGIKATVVLQCKWDERFEVAANIIDNEQYYPYFVEGELLPASISIQPMPGIKNLLDTDGNFNEYKFARLTINYTAQTTDLGSGESPVKYIESVDVNAEMLKIPPDN